MTRRENPDQSKDEFVKLGHIPYLHKMPLMNAETIACETCQCFIGSQDGCNPCGDRLGTSLTVIKQPDIWIYKNQPL